MTALNPPHRQMRASTNGMWARINSLGLDGTQLAILAFFASQVMASLSPYRESSRKEIVSAGAVQIAILGVGCGMLFAEFVRGRRRPAIPRGDRPPFAVLLVWAFVGTLAAVKGIFEHHQVGYVVGDYYKFLALPILFALWYFSVRTTPQLEFMWRALLLVLGVAIVVDIVRYYPQLNQVNRFATAAVDEATAMTPLLLYAFFAGGPRSWRVLLVVVFAETLLGLSWAQRLGGFLGYLLTLGLLAVFLILGRRGIVPWTGLRPRVLGGLTLAVLATLALNLWGGFPIGIRVMMVNDHPAVQVVRGLSYIRGRAEVLTEGGPVASVVESVSGSRAAELTAILRMLPRQPLLGNGLGGTLRPIPLGLANAPWNYPKHYIHAGLFEVLYRSGLAGLLTLTALFVVIFFRGARLLARQRHPFGVFVMVNAVVQWVLLAVDSSLMFPYVSLALSFAGVSVLEQSRDFVSNGPASSEAGVPHAMSNTMSAG